MARSRRGAPTVEVDAARGVVAISGKVVWETRQGGLDIARQKTAYRIEIPLEGSPFAPGFETPAKGTIASLGRDGALRFGEPLAEGGVEAAEDQRALLFRVSERRALEGFGTEAVGVKGPGGELSIQGAEGSFKSAAVIGFNGRMTAVTEVSILMRAKLESPDGEVSRGVLLGLDDWKGGLKIVAGAAQGSGAGGAGDPGGSVGGVPGTMGATGAGDPALRGEAADDLLRGRAGDDALHGRGGDDALHGRGGDDVLLGGRGADRLHDGAGEDRLQGGRGADVFVLSQDGARDVIADFDPARDAIDLTAFGRGLGFADLDLSARDGGVILRLGGEALEIHGADGALAPGDLDPDAFLFA